MYYLIELPAMEIEVEAKSSLDAFYKALEEIKYEDADISFSYNEKEEEFIL